MSINNDVAVSQSSSYLLSIPLPPKIKKSDIERSQESSVDQKVASLIHKFTPVSINSLQPSESYNEKHVEIKKIQKEAEDTSRDANFIVKDKSTKPCEEIPVSIPIANGGSIEFKKSDVLGEGKHGVVYSGILKHPQYNSIKDKQEITQVALKMNVRRSDPATNERYYRRLLHETEVLSYLKQIDDEDHNIVRHIGKGSAITEGLGMSEAILVMPKFSYDLYKYRRMRTPSFEEVQKISSQLFNGLSFLHFNGIIHTDLKPENIMLEIGSDGDPLVRICDFGLSVRKVEHIIRYYITSGTLNYYAPEVVFQKPANTPIDIFSAGCVVYEFLTGKQLFSAENLLQLKDMFFEVCGSLSLDNLKVVGLSEKDFVVDENHLYYPKMPYSPDKHFLSGSRPHQLTRAKTYINRVVNRFAADSTLNENTEKMVKRIIVDFIWECVQWNPCNRPKAKQAISHQFFQGLRTRPQINAKSLA